MRRKTFKATASVFEVHEPESASIRSGREIAVHMKDIRTFAQEGFFVLTMNSRAQIINSYMVSLGTLTATLVHPREVFRPAIYDGAAAIALVHNHPSGECSPSMQDRSLTERMVECAKLLGITINDHVIIGYERTGRKTSLRHFSFREAGYLD